MSLSLANRECDIKGNFVKGFHQFSSTSSLQEKQKAINVLDLDFHFPGPNGIFHHVQNSVFFQKSDSLAGEQF